jgi:hypothetical protein
LDIHTASKNIFRRIVFFSLEIFFYKRWLAMTQQRLFHLSTFSSRLSCHFKLNSFPTPQKKKGMTKHFFTSWRILFLFVYLVCTFLSGFPYFLDLSSKQEQEWRKSLLLCLRCFWLVWLIHNDQSLLDNNIKNNRIENRLVAIKKCLRNVEELFKELFKLSLHIFGFQANNKMID